MNIGEKTVKHVSERVEALARYHLSEINEAYLKFGEDDPDFKITFKATFKPAADGGLKVPIEISFPPGPNIKDQSTGYVNEGQLNLFEDKKVVNIRDRRGPVGNPPRFKPLGG